MAGLVYVSALAPDAGETTGQQYEGFAPTPDFVIDVVDDGYGFLNHDKFKAGFAHDASDADAAFLRDTQIPISMSVFDAPVKNAAWRDKPTWAVIATEDKRSTRPCCSTWRRGAARRSPPCPRAMPSP